MADGSIRISTEIDNSKVKSGLNTTKRNIDSSINTISGSLKKIAALIASVFSLTKVYQFSKGCVQEASKAQAALIGLQSIVEGQGRSFQKAKGFIDDYISDGLVPLSNATTAYKNLAARGYSDDQIQKTMLALKDSAAFARQGSLSYGDAIQGATEGLKNENSVLVDNAGVTKNVSVMWKEYAQSIGTTVDKLTTQQKIQAEVNGILNETRFQTGDAAKYAATYAGQTAKLSANFLNLRQNIGALLQGLFGQVIVWTGKAIDSINVFVQAIGQVIAMFTGKNPLESFSGGIKDTSKTIKDTANGISGIGNSADKSSKKVKDLEKQLTGFDQINKISSNKDSSDSSGGNGGVSRGNSGFVGNIGELESKISDNASAKIKKLAKQIKKFLDDTIKIIKKYEPSLKGVGAAFLTAFGFKWVAGAVKKFLAMKGVQGIILAIKKALLTTITVFNLTGNPLKALAAGFSSAASSLMSFLKNLTPMQKFQASLVALVATFVTTYNAVKEFTKGNMDLGTALLNIVPLAGAVGVAMYGMLGPTGLVLEAITLLIGGIVGVNKAQEELREELNDSIVYENTGTKIDVLTQRLVENNKELNNTISRINEWGETIEENNKKIDDNISTIGYYADKVIYGGNITSEETQKMITAFQEVRSSVKENFELSTRGILETFRTTLSGVVEDVGIDMKTISGHVFEFQNLFGKKTGELESNIKSLEDQILRSGPTPELLEKYGELQQQYVELNSEVPLATTKFQEQIKAFNDGKINFEDTDTAKTKIQELGSTFQELMTGIGQNKEQTLNEFDNLIRQVPLLVSDPEKQQQLITAFEGYKETTRKGFELKEEDIKAQFYTQAQRIQDSFNQKLNEVAENTAPTLWEKMTTSGGKFANEYEENLKQRVRQSVADLNSPIQDEINNLINTTKPKSVELGKNIPVNLGDGINNNASVPIEKIYKIIENLNTTAQNKELIRNYFNAGNNIDDGLAKGLVDKKHIPEEQARLLGASIIEETKKALDSHSPSKKMQIIGEDSDQGLANGLRSKREIVLTEARNMVNELVNIFRNMKLTFDITFPDIRNSGNALISRFQTILNNITSGMNTWLSRTTRSLNGLYIYGDGKVGYSSISRISIPRLAKGGITYRPTYAQIGEAGKEAVLPLENNTEWMDTLAEKLANKIGIGKNDSGNTVIYITVDGEVIQKVVKKRQKKNDFATNGGN